MAFYQFCREQKFKATLDEIWEFISSPGNLKEITPDYMGFDITTPGISEKMYPGMIISYTVRPLWGIKTIWVTEITQVCDKQFFVDEQRMGPYVLWHHQHHIKPIEGGIIMHDIVSYAPPFGFLGRLANMFVIKRKLAEIFDYRQQALEKRYGKWD